jgi:hypothetical protein
MGCQSSKNYEFVITDTGDKYELNSFEVFNKDFKIYARRRKRRGYEKEQELEYLRHKIRVQQRAARKRKR